MIGNHVWDCSLSVDLHTSGNDQSDIFSRDLFSLVGRILRVRSSHQKINESEQDFRLYSLKLRTIDQLQTIDSNYIQSATSQVVQTLVHANAAPNHGLSTVATGENVVDWIIIGLKNENLASFEDPPVVCDY